MTRLTIDTSTEQYQTMHTRFTAMRQKITPMLKDYNRSSPEAKAIWLENDPLLQDVIQWCNRVAGMQD